MILCQILGGCLILLHAAAGLDAVDLDDLFIQVRDILADDHLDDRKRAILTAFLKLSPADQDAILRYVDGVVSELNAQPAAPDLDVDAEVEAYRQELLAQKKAEAAASATAGSAAG